MRGLVLAVLVVAGCAAVTEANPPGPPPPWSRRYAGRIVLSAPTIRGDVERFEQPWARRLSILGLDTRIVYDDARAVFDVFGTDPAALSAVVGALSDPGGWYLGPADVGNSFLVQWMPATTGCDCVGQMELTASRGAHTCDLATGGPYPIARAGQAAYQVDLKIRWRSYTKPINGNGEEIVVESDVPDPGKECPGERWPRIIVKLRPGTTPSQATAIALALGGGNLPEVPRLDSIAPAGGVRP